ncbi:MAG: glycerol-3-phosphate 1-O-acyltransferase PlsY [Deltaproteobacteria bacterium]|nr:glycerol-3-phosphate 1-O-acyltransferase PlsY [Deltaproteobacteria bacterium]
MGECNVFKWVLLGYGLGSISFATLVAKCHGVEIRKVGSGNPGASNVARVLGKRAGRLVLVLDALKGALPVWVALRNEGEKAAAWAALAAVTGHCFPIWHRFEGGKGVATAAGALVVLDLPAALGGMLAHGVARRLTSKASLRSIAGIVVGCGVALRLWPAPRAWAALGMGAIALWRHRENFVRLLEGSELDA